MSKLIVGNWKMNGTLSLVDEFAQKLDERVILSVPSVFVAYAYSKRPALQLAAQDCSIYNDFGAHTGEISAKMLSNIGCKYVILGHSERRHTSGFDTPQNVLLKLQNVVSCGMSAIFCVDENYSELIDKQTEKFLNANVEKIIIAYEPLSAIGTGNTPSSGDISEALFTIKNRYCGVNTLYGGSVNVSNAKEILAIGMLDGVLIGGASLKLRELNEIAKLCE